jgi:SAM-dependent methyltransferase
VAIGAIDEAAADGARAAYDALADAYDDFTAAFPHERWLAALEAIAREHGLPGRRVLDVGCGTGKSLLPLVARGYDVTGCDLSPAMLAHARAKAPGVRLVEADMRALPDLGRFDLVQCLDDALNYLTAEHDLSAALRGFRRALAPEGLALWDVNTLAMYRDAFARTWTIETPERFIAWRGQVVDAVEAGGMAEARIDVFERLGGTCRARVSSVHRQRHWAPAVIVELASRAGLRMLDVLGQHRGARIERRLDERVHTKAVFVACRDDRRAAGGDAMRIGSP